MKRSWLALCLPVVACLAQPSFGAPVTFSPSGTGAGTVQVGVFDQLPGNALAKNAQALINQAVTTLGGAAAGTQITTGPFTVYYQANMVLVSPGPQGSVISTPGFNFTAVAKFQETATVTAGSNTVVFNLAPNAPGANYLDFFATKATVGNNATGAGFAAPEPTATLIYSGTPIGPGSGNFTNNGGSSNLDSFTPAGPQQTINGIGGTDLNFATTFVNSNYFVTSPGPLLTFTTQNKTPFTTVVPSSQFVDVTQNNGVVSSVGFVAPALGSLNGSGAGPDFQFQVDANSSFSVPEPASVAMTLIGLGSMGLGTVVTRRRAKARATVA